MRSGFAFLMVAAWLGVNSMTARADDPCEYYKKFLPSLYKNNCGGGAKFRKNSGSGSSTVAAAYNINPSALPTDPTPYGIEFVGSVTRTDPAYSNINFALIKGFQKIGTGISTTNYNTFYGNDLTQRRFGSASYNDFEPLETVQGKLPNLNLGTSFALPFGKKGKGLAVSLGLAGKYNKTTNSLGWGAGLMFRKNIFIFGGGVSRESVSAFLPTVLFYSGMVGIRLLIFEANYTFLHHYADGFKMRPIHIGTVSATLGPVILTAAARNAEYFQEGAINQFHYAAQVQLGKHLSAGFLINHIPGASSVALQIFL